MKSYPVDVFFSQANFLMPIQKKQDDSWYQCGFWNDTCHIDGPLWTQQVVLAIALAIIYGRSSVILAGMMRERERAMLDKTSW